MISLGVGFVIGLFPLVLLGVLLKTRLVLSRLDDANEHTRRLLDAERLPQDIPPTPTHNCEMHRLCFTSCPVTVSYPDASLAPTPASVTLHQSSFTLTIGDETYPVSFANLTATTLPASILRYTPASRLYISSEFGLVPNHKALYLQFARPCDLEYFASLCAAKAQQTPPLPVFSELAGLLERYSKEQRDTSWFYGVNFLVHRIFYTFYNNTLFLTLVRQIIQEKMTKTQKPSVIEAVVCEEFSMGPRLPVFCDPHVTLLQDPNKYLVQALVHYHNGFELRCRTQLKIVKTFDVVVVVKMRELHSMAQVMFQDLPTEYLWVGFVGDPQVDLKVEFVGSVLQSLPEAVVSRVVNFFMTFVRKEILGSFVLPYMKFIRLPSPTPATPPPTCFRAEFPTANEDYRRHKQKFERLEKERKAHEAF